MAISIAETLVGTLVIFVLLQTFVGRTYAVEQTSMQPTLEAEQRLIVDRLTPRFDPYKPGDIVVFDAPATVALDAPAIKRVIAYQIAQEMKRRKLTKSEMATRMNTSRAALERLLDPSNASVTLSTLERAASALGKTLKIELA